MKKKQLIAIAVVCVLVVLTGIAGIAMAGGSRAKSSRKAVIGPYVSVIPIYGTIGETSSDLFGNETSLSAGAICDYLDQIAEDENNKGVFLSIDSPGGYVYDTDKIYQALMEYKKKTGRPVTAACYSMMCSLSSKSRMQSIPDSSEVVISSFLSSQSFSGLIIQANLFGNEKSPLNFMMLSILYFY